MLKSLCLIIKLSFKNKIQLLLEIAMLAKQLEIYQRTDPKLKIHRIDRMFFSLMMDWLSNWKERLFIVKPETVIKWHRTAFRIFWRWKSQHKGGRPKVSREVIVLIKQMANENPKWRAPRIHWELMILGFNICESTVQRYMPKKEKRTTDQNWITFLKNHSKEIISMDFLTVPTINFKLMYVLIMIEHHRRKLIHFKVTKNPTAEWCLRQIRNLLIDFAILPKYLIRDRDMKYGTLLAVRKTFLE
jgi:hypothetical protein